MILHVVHMLRWGDPESHSYIEGIYSKREDAETHSKTEEEYRGGKYEPVIRTFKLDEPREEKYMPDEEVDKMYADAVAKSRLDNPELWKEWDEM